MESRKTAGRAMLLLLIVMLALTTVSLLPESVAGVFKSDTALSLIAIETSFFLIPAVIMARVQSKTAFIRFRIRPFRLKYLRLVLLSAVAASFAAVLLNYLLLLIIQGVSGSDSAEAAQTLTYYEMTWRYLLAFALMPAFCEEYLFRGLILGSIEGYGRLPAILLSGLLFAFIHTDIFNFFGPLLAGIVYAYLAIKTDSLLAPILAHFINNLLTGLFSGIILKLQWVGAAFLFLPGILIIFLIFLYFTLKSLSNLDGERGELTLPALESPEGRGTEPEPAPSSFSSIRQLALNPAFIFIFSLTVFNMVLKK